MRQSILRRLLPVAIALLLFTLTVVCRGVPQPATEISPESSSDPTSTRESSATPTPTAIPSTTPSPTASPTATATLTPDLTSTAQVVEEQRIDKVTNLIQNTMDRLDRKLEKGSLGWAQEFPMVIELSEYDQVVFTDIADGMLAEDFIFKTDITWESTGGLAVCGFIFRLDFDEADYYQYGMLRLSGLPAWAILGFQNGLGQYDISGTRTSGAIDQDQSSTNEVLLIAREGRFTLYINNQRIGNFYDHSNRFREGGFGFVARQESGVTTCSYNNTWIWLLDED